MIATAATGMLLLDLCEKTQVYVPLSLCFTEIACLHCSEEVVAWNVCRKSTKFPYFSYSYHSYGI